MRIAIVTDAWLPQTNGVVTTLQATAAALGRRGHEVRVLSTAGLPSLPCPSYPEIRLAIGVARQLAAQLQRFAPQAIHVATEGPAGLAARRLCLRERLPFTTAYHTRYPEYLRARWPVPLGVSYAWLRRFHGAASRTFVSTGRLRQELAARGFRNLHVWPRGVDARWLHPCGRRPRLLEGLPRPVMAYMGRVAIEKNIEAFLRLKLPGTQLVIGDGPQSPELRRRFPRALFAGWRSGAELVELVSAADVFVFPSRTDTFGLAMLEALACGVPVAAFPVPGPLDVVEPGVTGVLDEDLASAIRGALRLDRRACGARAAAATWDAATERFLAGLQPIARAAPARRAGARLVHVDG